MQSDAACLKTKYLDRTAQLEQYLENVSFSRGTLAGRDGELTDRMVWKFRETGRGAARGARLDFSVPETDAVAFSAVCAAGANTAAILFGYPTPGLREGDKVALNIDIGNYQASEPGRVFGTRQQEGVSGSQVIVTLDDPLCAEWTDHVVPTAQRGSDTTGSEGVSIRN